MKFRSKSLILDVNHKISTQKTSRWKSRGIVRDLEPSQK